jgi:lipopolysaccharide heptosyltransferase II
MPQIIRESYLRLRRFFFSIFYLYKFFYSRVLPSQIKTILIISPPRLGDFIYSIPVLKSLKKAFPHSEITVVSNYYLKDFIKIFPFVEELISYKDYEDISILEILKIIKNLRRRKFDLGIDLNCNYPLKPALLLTFSKVKFKIGYDIDARGFGFDMRLNFLPNAHIKDILLKSIYFLTKENTVDSLSFDIPAQSIQKIEEILREKQITPGDFLIGIHPGAHYPTQRWPRERFLKLAEVLSNFHKVIIIDFRNNLVKTASSKAHVIADLSLVELASLIKRCNLLVCNNSGPLHLACSLGTPTVSMMGPTHPELWWPQGKIHTVIKKSLDCSPCDKAVCRKHRCMQEISLEEVLKIVKERASQLKNEYQK